MKKDNFWGLKKWRRPEGRPISISGMSVPDYTWSSVLLDRCAVLSEHPCKHRGASTATKITKITLVASPFLSGYTHHFSSSGVQDGLLNLIPH